MSSASSSTSCSSLVFSFLLLSRASHGGGEMAKVGLCVYLVLVPSLAKIKKEAATRRERRNDEHASEKIKKKQKKFPKGHKKAR